MLTRANISWTAKQLAGMVNKGRFDFGHAVQRPVVWKADRKSLLIHSMIEGYPIPPVFVTKKDDGTGKRGGNIYTPLDGNQRISTIAGFINNEYALTGLPEITYTSAEDDSEVTVNINGMTFSQLPEELQDAVKDYSLSVTYFESLTYAEEIEVFKRLNNGQVLTAAQRSIASCGALETLMRIGSHKLLLGEYEDDKCIEKGILSASAIRSKKQAIITAKALMMAKGDPMTVSFESKTFNAALEEMTISEEDEQMMLEIYDYMSDILNDFRHGYEDKKAAHKFSTETHFIQIVPIVKEALQIGIESTLVSDFIYEFFNAEDGATSTSEQYNQHCTGGNARSINISARHEALHKAFVEFINNAEGRDMFTEVA